MRIREEENPVISTAGESFSAKIKIHRQQQQQKNIEEREKETSFINHF